MAPQRMEDGDRRTGLMPLHGWKVAALSLLIAVVAQSGATLYCFFGTRHTKCAAQRRLSEELTWHSQCSKGEWTGLLPCMFGLHHAGCPEARSAWYNAGCMCDYDQYRSTKMSPIGSVWTMMALGKDYAPMAAANGCLEDESSCRAPRDGDVRLDAYGKGVAGALEVAHGGVWRQAVGAVTNRTALAVCERLGFKLGTVRAGSDAAAEPWDGTRMIALDSSAARAHAAEPGDVLALRLDAPPATPLARVRLECDQSGVAGCYVERTAERACVVDGTVHTRSTAQLDWPTMACGTAGSYFLTPELAPDGGAGARDTRGACELVQRPWWRTCWGAQLLAFAAWFLVLLMVLVPSVIEDRIVHRHEIMPSRDSRRSSQRSSQDEGTLLRPPGPASDEPSKPRADASAPPPTAGCCVCQ